MILLDTHVLVWMVASPEQLSRPAAREIRKAQQSGGCAIASISLWELALLFEKGRLRSSGVLEASIREIVETAAVTVLEITTDIAALTAMFPESYPKDPVDRLIGATARALGMTLIRFGNTLVDDAHAVRIEHSPSHPKQDCTYRTITATTRFNFLAFPSAAGSGPPLPGGRAFRRDAILRETTPGAGRERRDAATNPKASTFASCQRRIPN